MRAISFQNFQLNPPMELMLKCRAKYQTPDEVIKKMY